MLTVLGMLALPAGFLSAGVAFNSWRSGDYGLSWKAAAVFLVCALLFWIAPRVTPDAPSGDCHIDWDARSNSTVCD